jgi:hypothetical protein
MELAELPLAGKQPKWIVDSGLQTALHLSVAAERLKSHPTGD